MQAEASPQLDGVLSTLQQPKVLEPGSAAAQADALAVAAAERALPGLEELSGNFAELSEADISSFLGLSDTFAKQPSQEALDVGGMALQLNGAEFVPNGSAGSASGVGTGDAFGTTRRSSEEEPVVGIESLEIDAVFASAFGPEAQP